LSVEIAPDALEPSVTYVITVYNKRSYLPQVVAGLAAQQGDFAREFLFIDDGSTDGSGDEVARLTAGWSGVRIVSQTNHGLSHATNRGIAEARHNYVKLVDADDVLMPAATTTLLEALRQHPGAVFAYGRMENYTSAADAFARLAQPASSAPPEYRLIANPLPDLLLKGFSIGPTNTLFPTAIARSVGGCDGRVFIQDYSLALRLAMIGPFVATNAVIGAGPAVAEGRLNDGGPQCLHDANLALAYFLEEQKIPAPLATAAVRRATSRAAHWARRREGAGVFSYWTWLRLLARLPRAHPAIGLLRESCRAFTLSGSVRPGAG
jgi:glycosyltransferase involved in cell wall biosynthesis